MLCISRPPEDSSDVLSLFKSSFALGVGLNSCKWRRLGERDFGLFCSSSFGSGSCSLDALSLSDSLEEMPSSRVSVRLEVLSEVGLRGGDVCVVILISLRLDATGEIAETSET